MAFGQTIDVLGTGAPATYWKLVPTATNYVAGTITVKLEGFVSQAARSANMQPVVVLWFDIPLSALPTEPTRATMYTWLSAQATAAQAALAADAVIADQRQRMTMSATLPLKQLALLAGAANLIDGTVG